jgi:GntR family transcriptional regulator
MEEAMAHEPAYRRVVDALRAQVLAGELVEGARLPSVREITQRYGVTTGTAARAIAELRAEGLVITRHGAGVYVRRFRAIRRSSPARLSREVWGTGTPIPDTDTGDRPRAVDVEVGETPAPGWAATGLGIDPGTPVIYRSRRFLVDDRPVQLATSYLPAELVRGSRITYTDTGPGGIYARLAELGYAPATFTEYLRARMPHPDETDRLDLPDGTPVIEITRHARTDVGVCVEVNRMILDGTAYLLDYTFPA